MIASERLRYNGLNGPLKASSTVHCNIAFGDMLLNAPVAYLELHIDDLLPILIDMLSDIPRTDFERRLSWTGRFAYLTSEMLRLMFHFSEWAASDQLVFSIVSAALRITSSQPRYGDQTVRAIVTFINEMVKNVKTSTCRFSFPNLWLISNDAAGSTRTPHTVGTCITRIIPRDYFDIIPLGFITVGALGYRVATDLLSRICRSFERPVE